MIKIVPRLISSHFILSNLDQKTRMEMGNEDEIIKFKYYLFQNLSTMNKCQI